MVEDLDDRAVEARIRHVLTQALDDRAAPAGLRDLRVELDWHDIAVLHDQCAVPPDYIEITFATTTFWISRADTADDDFLRGLVDEFLDGASE